MRIVSSTETPWGGALDPAGPVAAEMARLWWWLLGLGLVAFAVFAVLMARSLLARRDAEWSASARGWIVGAGVIMPVLAVVAVLALTLSSMRVIPEGVPDDAIVVEVVGHQWWWEVRYPDEEVVTANEIHIPVDRQVALLLSSEDVIHSFWVPSLGGKIDLLPDGVNTMVLEADEPGRYRGSCAEFCGLQHARMGILVAAETVTDYDAWLEGQREPAREPIGSLEARGAEVFIEAGCPDCHTVRGSGATGGNGPDLTHLASRLTLAAGTVSNTAENLEDWVGSPHDVKSGVLMPDPELSEEDLEAVVAYLGSLE